MTLKRVPELFLAIILAGTMPLVSMSFSPVYGIFSSDIGTFTPSGSSMDNLLFNIYSTVPSEYNAFIAQVSGYQLDIPDAPVPLGSIDAIKSSSSLVITSPTRTLKVYGIEFNQLGNFWGCSFSYGNSPCGIEFRRGIAHLIGKDQFITQILTGGERADCFSSPLQGLPCAQSGANGNIPPWNVCSWDPMQPSCVSAFYLGSTTYAYGDVVIGSPDFCAAADHFVLGFQLAGIRPNGNPVTKGANCILQNAPSSGVVSIDTPVSNLGLDTLATAMSEALNHLVGKGASSSCNGGTFGLDSILGADLHNLSLTDTVDESPPSSPPSPPQPARGPSFVPCQTWEMATLGYSLSATYDQLYYYYNSKFTFNGYANSTLDRLTNQLEYNDSVSGALLSAESTEFYMGTNVVNLPIWSALDQFAYTNGWSGIVKSIGSGVPNYWTSLNAWRHDPAIPRTLSIGLTNVPVTLNVYDTFTWYNTFVLSHIYDSLVAPNPANDNQTFDSLATSHRTQCNPAGGVPCTSTTLGYNPPVGTVEAIRFTLRPGIRWQDGQILNSTDVRFSIISYRDTSTASYTAFVQDIADVHAVTAATFDILFSKHSPFHLFNVATLPVIPAHIWAKGGVCNGSSCTADPNKTSFFYDPVANHSLIGSGPYVCTDLSTGQLGGGCTSTGNEHVAIGGSISLRRFGYGTTPGTNSASSYVRSSGNLAAYIWSGNNGGSTHDFLVSSTVDGCFLKPVGTAGCTQWQEGILNPCPPPGCVVGFLQVSAATSFNGIRPTYPYDYLPGISYACCPFSPYPPTGAALLPLTLYEGVSTGNSGNPFLAGRPQIMYPAGNDPNLPPGQACSAAYPTGGYDC